MEMSQGNNFVDPKNCRQYNTFEISKRFNYDEMKHNMD